MFITMPGWKTGPQHDIDRNSYGRDSLFILVKANTFS